MDTIDPTDLEAEFNAMEGDETPPREAQVINMAAERQKRVPHSKEGAKTRELFDNLMGWVNGKRSALTMFPYPFPHRFVVRMPDEKADPIFYQVLEGDVYQRRSLEVITRMVFIECDKVLSTHGDQFSSYKMLPNMVAQFRRHWALYTPMDDAPISDVRFKSQPGACFKRLDFDPAPLPCPTWDQLMNENIISNADALQAWIGALFYPDMLPQQWVWLYGDGQNGKSSIMRLLQGMLGDAATRLETNNRMRDKFAGSMLYEKRLAVADDCKNPDFVESEWLMTASGGGVVTIDNKNEKAFAAKLNCMYFFTSNHRPNVSADRSIQRRAIFVEFKRSDEIAFINRLEKLLHEERAGIVWKCLTMFKNLYSEDLCEITADKVANMELAADVNDDFVDLFHSKWEVGDGEVTKKSINEEGLLAFGHDWNHLMLSKFIRFLEGQDRVKAGWKRLEGSRERVIRGMVRTTRESF